MKITAKNFRNINVKHTYLGVRNANTCLHFSLDSIIKFFKTSFFVADGKTSHDVMLYEKNSDITLSYIIHVTLPHE